MAKFLDVHPLKGVDEETLRKTQKMPKDEFGITHDNMMYNKEEGIQYFMPIDFYNNNIIGLQFKQYVFHYRH